MTRGGGTDSLTNALSFKLVVGLFVAVFALVGLAELRDVSPADADDASAVIIDDSCEVAPTKGASADAGAPQESLHIIKGKRAFKPSKAAIALEPTSDKADTPPLAPLQTKNHQASVSDDAGLALPLRC